MNGKPTVPGLVRVDRLVDLKDCETRVPGRKYKGNDLVVGVPLLLRIDGVLTFSNE